MATPIHPSIPVLSPSFFNSLRNIIASDYLLLFFYAVLLKLSYVCMPTFIATIANMAIMGQL